MRRMDPLLAALKGLGPAMLGWALFVVVTGGLLRSWIKGDFIPASQVDKMRADADKRVEQAIKETDRWHQLTLTQVGIIDDLSAQNRQLMEGTKVAVDVAAALPPAISTTGKQT